MKKEFTATTYIFDEKNRVLLLHHKTFKLWMAPGGHIESNETPPEAARREVLEETGYSVEFIRGDKFWVERKNAMSFEKPYHCMLQLVPEQNGKPPHQHMDMIYLAKKGARKNNHHEPHLMKWFTWNELQQLTPDEEIFGDTIDLLSSIYHNSKCLLEV